MSDISTIDLQISDAKKLKALTAYDYYCRIRSLALSCFEWSGLPDNIPARFIEKTLFELGRIAFFRKTDTNKIMAAKVSDTGMLNFYDVPLNYRVYGSPSFNQDVAADECVILRNNYDAIPTIQPIILFVNRLTEAERSIDVNVKAQKTPVVVTTDEKSLATMRNIFAQYTGDEPVIYIDKSLAENKGLKFIFPQVPYVTDKLMIYKRQIWNECMTFLGINNSNTEKKERMITDEARSNNQLIKVSASTMLLTRQEAAEQANKLFGCNIKVEMRDLSQYADFVGEVEMLPPMPLENEGDENG